MRSDLHFGARRAPKRRIRSFIFRANVNRLAVLRFGRPESAATAESCACAPQLHRRYFYCLTLRRNAAVSAGGHARRRTRLKASHSLRVYVSHSPETALAHSHTEHPTVFTEARQRLRGSASSRDFSRCLPFMCASRSDPFRSVQPPSVAVAIAIAYTLRNSVCTVLVQNEREQTREFRKSCL